MWNNQPRLKLWFVVLLLASLIGAVTGCAAVANTDPTPDSSTTAPTATATAVPPTIAATDTPQPTDTPEPIPFTLSSSAFGPNETIPERHSCDGSNLSPALTWTTPPDGTQSLALVLDDPDAVGVVGFVYDHWLLFNLPPDTTALPEGIGLGADPPEGSLPGVNSARTQRYAGPCPPSGQTHNYVFTLYALDTALDLAAGADKATLLEAMEGHILGTTQLIGVYTSP
ncbi:MAG: YbhB/YbcL family Raf kinase inhibitor-like protein [Anaerolineae bacterium]|nr:YbhB/YbcL family Raf kinase inhibitor-like protein [Anaerolineae bacterium]